MLSDKTARQEFGLTQARFTTRSTRHAAVPPSPYAREPVAETAPPRGQGLARARHGDRYVSDQQARAELTRVNRGIRRLQTELAELEERRAKLGSDLGE